MKSYLFICCGDLSCNTFQINLFLLNIKIPGIYILKQISYPVKILIIAHLSFLLPLILYCECKDSPGMGFYFYNLKTKHLCSNLTLPLEKEYPQDLVISFDISFYNLNRYGYLAELKNDFNQNLLITCMFTRIDTFSLSLHSGDVSKKVEIDYDKIHPYQWQKIDIHLKQNYIEVCLNGDPVLRSKNPDPRLQGRKVIFGYQPDKIDTPSMIIRNLTVSDTQDKTLAFWPLNGLTDSGSLSDSTGKYRIYFNDLIPMTYKHWYWEQFIERPIPDYPKQDRIFSAWDSSRRELHILSYTEHIIVEPDWNRETVHPFPEQFPKEQKIVYNPVTKEIVSYHHGRGAVYTYNRNKNEWITPYHEKPSPQFYRHCHFFDEKGTLYMAGGYGYYTAKNLVQYWTPSGGWDTLDVKGDDDFFLRSDLICAAGLTPGTVILGSGRGNAMGLQENGYDYLYDFWSFTPETRTLEYLDSYKPAHGTIEYIAMTSLPRDSLLFIAALVFPDKSDDDIKTRLFSVHTAQKELIPVGSDLPYMVDISLTADTLTNELILTGQTPPPSSVVKSYRLLLPVYPPPTSHLQKKNSSFVLHKYIAMLLILLIFLTYVWFKKDKKSQKHKKPVSVSGDYEIRLLGNFSFLQNNNPLALPPLSAQNRELLLLLLIHSYSYWRLGNIMNSHVLNNDMLNIFIWPEASKQAFKNRKNVAFNRLRKWLEDSEYLELQNNQGRQAVRLKKGVSCDFYRLRFMLEERKTQLLSQQETEDFIHLATRGPLLENVSYVWLDPIRHKIREETIKRLKELLTITRTEDEQQLAICNAIFKWDDLDLTALRTKIQIYKKRGDLGLMKQELSSFSSRYKDLFDEEFKESLENLARDPE